ncbi:phage tail fiber protein [Vreelandella aquamarina]|uniref:Phage tail protein C-terminal domain-containing protein n=2 Tax=Vreelandella aquamarina TaxID=77097 RepID=A0A1N6DN76_9GAMM|nr:hypothetical protein [Halomonas meridiana]SIN62320.1 hypothetical protein SAMN05878438_0851 [Halomonas meridiana]SIN72261.1 hypothetical protein SAMN05878249_3068 [Halomonas meridiana]SIO21355.1 hypothetical protein SAMN05878442_1536 [Halomonas meridiana]
MAAPTNYDQTNEWLAEVGRLTQDLINVLKGGIDVGQSGTLGNLALINDLANAPVGNAATARNNLGLGNVATRTIFTSSGLNPVGFPDYVSNIAQTIRASAAFFGSYYPTATSRNIDLEPIGSVGLYSGGNPGTYPSSSTFQLWWIVTQSVYTGTQCVQFATAYRGDGRAYRYGEDNGDGTRTWRPWVILRDSSNTTVDSNGFIKAASPIFRLANSADSAIDESHNFTAAGAGASNAEAQGVIASHDDIGAYIITGSLGFAKAGWTVEVPQDANGNRLCVVETEQADDGTITVRTFSKRIDSETGDVVAYQPMDIPEGRWIDLRLSMPEPPTNDHPDDAPEPPAPLTPEEQEQQRIEQLERWRASASITPRQARLVLAKHSLLTGVTDAIAAIEDEQQRQVAEIEWEYATTIERAAPWVNDLYGSLGLTPEGVDELFREAALL